MRTEKTTIDVVNVVLDACQAFAQWVLGFTGQRLRPGTRGRWALQLPCRSGRRQEAT